MDYVTISLKSSEIFGGGGSSRKARRIFVAFEFVDRSRRFKDDLKRELEANWNVSVLDGSDIRDGEDWSARIQAKIRDAGLVIADVSNTSREVMFEIGFAGNKPSIYVVSSRDDLARVPSWLTIKQARFYDGRGVLDIAQSIAGMFDTRKFPRAIHRVSRPATATIVVSPGQTWAQPMTDQIAALLQENGVSIATCDARTLLSGQDLAGTASAQFIFATIDGQTSDYLSHYLLGDVAGRRQLSTTGPEGRTTMQRHGFVLTPDFESYRANSAEGLTRVSTRYISHVTDFPALKSLMKPMLLRAREWRLSGGSDSL